VTAACSNSAEKRERIKVITKNDLFMFLKVEIENYSASDHGFTGCRSCFEKVIPCKIVREGE